MSDQSTAAGWRSMTEAPTDRPILLTSRYCSNPCVCRMGKKDWIVLNEDGGAAIQSQGDTWTEYCCFSVPDGWMELPVRDVKEQA